MDCEISNCVCTRLGIQNGEGEQGTVSLELPTGRGMLLEVRQAAKESDKILGWWQCTTYRSACFPKSGKGGGTGLGAPLAWLRLCAQLPDISRNKQPPFLLNCLPFLYGLSIFPKAQRKRTETDRGVVPDGLCSLG